MTEKSKVQRKAKKRSDGRYRAPGGGRKPVSAENRLRNRSVKTSDAEWEEWHRVAALEGRPESVSSLIRTVMNYFCEVTAKKHGPLLEALGGEPDRKARSPE